MSYHSHEGWRCGLLDLLNMIFVCHFNLPDHDVFLIKNCPICTTFCLLHKLAVRVNNLQHNCTIMYLFMYCSYGTTIVYKQFVVYLQFVVYQCCEGLCWNYDTITIFLSAVCSYSAMMLINRNRLWMSNMATWNLSMSDEPTLNVPWHIVVRMSFCTCTSGKNL